MSQKPEFKKEPSMVKKEPSMVKKEPSFHGGENKKAHLYDVETWIKMSIFHLNIL